MFFIFFQVDYVECYNLYDRTQIYMLTRTIKRAFSFNILNTFKQLKQALKAPIKHIKAATEPAGSYYNVQTNTTEQAFDEVSQQWQAFVGGNPFDLQTMNYLENAQLANFGTVDNPLVIFTADAPFRYVGCSGAQNQDDYESHELFWIMLRQGPLQRCAVCGQVFKLVRLRNQFSSQMDYYMTNFNKLWYQDMGEHDTTNLLSISKMNTHFEPSLFEQPTETAYSFVGMDDHDRALVDPAYRVQKLTEGELKARIYLLAMQDYEIEKLKKSPFRHPISKIAFQNMMDSEILIKKLDRSFRQVVKFESRKYIDPENHPRRQARMLERSKKRWDGSYTLYSGTLTEEQQRYRDYFETDLEKYRQDQRLEEFLDRQQLLSDERYSLRHFDFQESYTTSPEDDQSSYVEKKAFKFKYRRALDKAEDYQRRNKRMIENQRTRFEKANYDQLLQNYVNNPRAYEKDYLNLIKSEAVSQYQDYFQTDKDELETAVLEKNSLLLSTVFQNWHLPRQDSSSFQTFPLPQWNLELGFWPNAITLLGELSQVKNNIAQIEKKQTLQTLSQTSLVSKTKQSK